MINPERIRTLCHPEVFKRLPVGEIQEFRLVHVRSFLSNGSVRSRGGTTILKISIKNIEYQGAAVCSFSDNYCKKTGRELAFKRAIRQYWDSVK